MRIHWYIVVLALVVFIGLLIWPRQPFHHSSVDVTPTPTMNNQAKTVLAANGHKFSYYLHLVSDPSSLGFIPNYQTARSSHDLITANQCRFSVNGGFYQENRQPLGWLYQNGNQSAPAHTSQIHNAFFAVSPAGPTISTQQPDITTGFGFQTGPLLIEQNLPLTLAITPDEPRRRIVATLLANKQLVFITIFDPNTPFGGPNLSDTPKLLIQIAHQESLTFTSALNLDGGSASVFYEENGPYLQELYPVGGLICQK